MGDDVLATKSLLHQFFSLPRVLPMGTLVEAWLLMPHAEGLARVYPRFHGLAAEANTAMLLSILIL